GVDDMSGLSEYARCVFFENNLEVGAPDQVRFELDLQRGSTVSDCAINGRIKDPLQVVNPTNNFLNLPGLKLGEDGMFESTPSGIAEIGCRLKLRPLVSKKNE